MLRSARRAAALLVTAALAACSDATSTDAPDLTAPAYGKSGGSTAWAGGPVTSKIESGYAGYAASGSVTYANGVSGVVSEVQTPLGDWVLETNGKRSTRFVHINLGTREAIYDASLLPPFTEADVQGRFISKFSQTGVATPSYPNMTAGQTSNAPLAFAFTYGTRTYRVTMNPGSETNPAPELLDTDWVAATCVSVASDARCNRWSLAPTGVGGNRGLLMLVNADNSTTPIALVRMNFSIGFSR